MKSGKTDCLKFIHKEVPRSFVLLVYILLFLCAVIFIAGIIFLKTECDRLNFSGIYTGETEVPYDVDIKSCFDSSLPPADLEIYVDLSRPEREKASIFIMFNKPERENSFHTIADPVAFKFENIFFYNEKGKATGYLNDRSSYSLKPSYYKKIFLSYTVKPGGQGRHGRQGYISEDFACFDGRVFILPENYSRINTARIKFKVTPGWEIINPHRKHGDYYYPDYSGKGMVYYALLKSPMAFGPFDENKKKFGSTELCVYTYSQWDGIYKKNIKEKTSSLYEYFFTSFGFDPGVPYIVCWVPFSFDGERIFGGMWSNGQCFEMPEESLRNWQLLAHRLAHAVNIEKPTGMVLKDTENSWFFEGWAVYTEIQSLSSLGLGDEKKEWNRIYKAYLNILRENPQWDCPLIEESKTEGAQREFIHYYKEPLVMKMLDYEMRKRAGKTMEEFIGESYRKYKKSKEPFSFKEGLEKFCGVSFEDFWDKMIREKGRIEPVWEYEDEN